MKKLISQSSLLDTCLGAFRANEVETAIYEYVGKEVPSSTEDLFSEAKSWIDSHADGRDIKPDHATTSLALAYQQTLSSRFIDDLLEDIKELSREELLRLKVQSPSVNIDDFLKNLREALMLKFHPVLLQAFKEHPSFPVLEGRVADYIQQKLQSQDTTR